MNLKEIKKYIKAHQLDTPARYRVFNDIRGVLYFYLREERRMSFTEIGKLFNRDHATVINGIKRHNELSRFKDHQDNTKNVRAFLKYHKDLTKIDLRQELIKCDTLVDFHRLKTQVEKGLI